MAQVLGVFNIKYSTKNIPLVNNFKYQKLLTVRVEDVIKRMRWKLVEMRPVSKNFQDKMKEHMTTLKNMEK